MTFFFAGAFAVIACTAGIALDFTRAQHARAAVQTALDSALLDVAKRQATLGTAALQSEGARLFEAQFHRSSFGADMETPQFAKTGAVVNAAVNVTVDTTLSSLLGYKSIPVSVRSAATTSGKGMELMLVVDVSGSMGSGGKIGALRSAATKLLDAIYGAEDTRVDTWVGVTPFSGRVNIFDYGAGWMTGAGPGWANRLCADRRSPPNVENDEPPSTEAFPHYWATSGYVGTETCPAPRALGLTPNRSTVQASIDGLYETAGTSTQVGMVWGWRMVSPKWRGLWGDASLPKTAAETPGKYVIMMTDGDNHPFESADDVASPLGDPALSTADVDQRLLRECTAMKAEGITIFTVAFDMGAALTTLYQSCASTSDYHFDVQSNNELIEVFEKLGMTISGNSPRLIN